MANDTLGTFTAGVAKRTQKGPPRISENDKQATDKWTVWLPQGGSPMENTITGLPEIGDEWDLDEDYVCDEITWENSFPNEYWVANVHYAVPEDVEADDEEIPEGVVLKKITYNPTAWNVDCEFDAGNGVPVRNTAGDRFQDALTTQIYTTSIVIETMEDKVPVEDLALQGTINATSEKIGGVDIEPHCGLLTISIQQGTNPDYPFEVTRTIQIATNPLPDEGTIIYSSDLSGDTQSAPAPRDEPARTDLGYDICVLNAGYRYWDGGKDDGGTQSAPAPRKMRRSGEEEEEEHKLKRFLDETPEGDKVLAVDPHVLKDDGDQAGDEDVYWLVFQRYPDASWPQWYPKKAPKKKDVEPETP